MERNKIAIDLEKKKRGYTLRKESSASGKNEQKMSGGDGTKKLPRDIMKAFDCQ